MSRRQSKQDRLVSWTFNSPANVGPSSAAKIIQFYVVECPAEGASKRGLTFSQLGWRGARFSTLQARMRKSSTLTADRWKCEKLCDIESQIEKSPLNAQSPLRQEYALYAKSKNYGKVESLFYLIRCALAHGSFDVRTYKKERYYLFENRYRNQLRGRAVLKEKTLLRWIDETKLV